MNRITGRRQRVLLCSGKQVQKNETKLNNNLEKLQTRNIKQIFPQTAFTCSIWSHCLCNLHIKYFRPTSSVLPILVTGFYNLILVNQPVCHCFSCSGWRMHSFSTNSTYSKLFTCIWKNPPGDHSYAFYLYHFPREGLPERWIVQYCTICCSIFAYHLFVLRLKPPWKCLPAVSHRARRYVLCWFLSTACLRTCMYGACSINTTTHHLSDPRVGPLTLQAQLESACTRAKTWAGTDLWINESTSNLWEVEVAWLMIWLFFWLLL